MKRFSPSLVLALAASATLTLPAAAQLAPTFGVTVGLQGYSRVPNLTPGFTAEVTGGVEWPGRTRLELGGTIAAAAVTCQLECSGPGVETFGLFGEVSRLLGQKDAGARFVLAVRAGYEYYRPRGLHGLGVGGRMGGEFRLGGRTALSLTGLVGWVSYDDFDPAGRRDFRGLRLGINLGLRVHPSG